MTHASHSTTLTYVDPQHRLDDTSPPTPTQSPHYGIWPGPPERSPWALMLFLPISWQSYRTLPLPLCTNA